VDRGAVDRPAGDVAVIGMGVSSPAGNTVAQLWAGLLRGTSFVSRLPVELDGLVLIGAPVDDGHRDIVLPPPERRRVDRLTDLALTAATEAAADARLTELGVVPERFGAVVGTGSGATATFTEQYDRLRQRGWRAVSPYAIPSGLPNGVTTALALRFLCRGPVTTVSNACASGTQAVAEAVRLLRGGYADVVLAGASEAPLSVIALAGFTRMEAMSRRVGEPERASRPFDRDRDGFVLGEGAAFFVLERLEDARSAGHRVRAVVAGTGLTCDAVHKTAPDPEGQGARRCLQEAIAESGLAAGDLAHVNAHGTGTPLNDRIEALALRRVFGGDVPPTTSCKGAIGHLMGASGAVELVATIVAMNAGTVPVTVNCDALDPAIDLDVVTGEPRTIPVGPAICSSFGFGGVNASVVVRPAATSATTPVS
jgi:3-oxoacyl-[acyl-carrier-protein] synthase II